MVDNPGILELGHPAVITAKVTDPSGIKSVILTLTRPSQYVKSTYTMNTTDYVYYSYTVQNTSLLGIYDFTITATDASEFHNKTTVSQSFRIIEDQTPPSLNYTGALPFAQLAGGYVEIRCLTWDFSGLRSVTVKITAPGSTLLGYTLTMNKEGYYVLNYTYSTIGQYTYVVTSEDVYNNSRSSVPATFWITDDLNDTDNDGMPDVWERTNGFDPYNPADAVLDADHDGSTNLQEYREGTNPLQASVPSALAAFGDHAGYLTASVVLFAVILLLCVFLLRRRQP